RPQCRASHNASRPAAKTFAAAAYAVPTRACAGETPCRNTLPGGEPERAARLRRSWRSGRASAAARTALVPASDFLRLRQLFADRRAWPRRALCDVQRRRTPFALARRAQRTMRLRRPGDHETGPCDLSAIARPHRGAKAFRLRCPRLPLLRRRAVLPVHSFGRRQTSAKTNLR